MITIHTLKEKFKDTVFGVRKQGEKLKNPSPIIERPMNEKEFVQWCKHVKFGMLYDRKIVHI